MQTIKVEARVGPDGVLKLELPVGMPDRNVEVLVVMQPLPVNPVSNPANREGKTPEELGWPPGFFERTYGALADDPIERPPQEYDDYEVREGLL